MRALSLSCALALALALAALPCAAQQDHAAHAAHGAHADHAASHGIERLKAPAGARVFIISPQDGATVGQEVTVRFGIEGMAIKPAGDMSPGSGHHHLLIDVDTLPALDLPIPDDAHHKHFGKGQTETTIHLEPGTHTLQLDLGDARHVQFDPPIVSKVITIHVK